MKTRRRYVVALGIILLFGILRLPLESRLETRWDELRLRGPKLDLSMREKIGQTSFVAALGGFRSLVASLLTLEANTHWQYTEYEKLRSTFDLIVNLQPRTVGYWDEYAWHVGWNERAFYLYDRRLPEALRRKLATEAEQSAREIFEDGIRNNPDDYLLYHQLAVLYKDMIGDPCLAAKYYQASADRGGPEYARRFVGYLLADCPGREPEAYERLLELYHEGDWHHKPRLLRDLRRLEELLEIPEADRIPPGEEPEKEPEPGETIQ